MKPTDRQAFAEMLSEVMAYYGRSISTFMLTVFWDGLKMHTLEDVSRALTLHARDPDHGQWPPKVADISRLLEGSTSSQGMRAWAVVEKALRMVGGHASVVFDQPLIHAVISDMGGWPALCQTQVEKLPFVAREFERRYAAYRLRRELPDYPDHLIGHHEAENRLKGYPPARPTLIGDQDRATAVMLGGAAGGVLQIQKASEVMPAMRPGKTIEQGKGQAA